VDTELLVMTIPILLAAGLVPVSILFLGILLLQQRER
jgi:hypothetical protein